MVMEIVMTKSLWVWEILVGLVVIVAVVTRWDLVTPKVFVRRVVAFWADHTVRPLSIADVLLLVL